jgi:WD40 repeat protein
LVLTASRDGSAALWNATTGSPLGIRLKHNSAILSASFSNDGSRIVTGSADHTARVWDAKTGKLITPALQHPTFVTEAAMSPDNRFVATASVDQTVRFWDATTGDTLHLPLHTHGGLAHLAFSPDSSSIVVTEGSDVLIFDTPPSAPAPAWLPLLAEFDAALYNKYDYRPFDRAPMRIYLHQLEDTKDNDPWTRLGRWYFAPGASRTVTPLSNLALETYVSALMKQGDGPSLEYARDLSQGHPQWLEKITPLLAKTNSTSAQDTKKD